MSVRIDAELERIKKLGQTPKAIHIGSDLYLELYSEQNPVYAAPIVSDGQEAPAYPDKDVAEYQGIKVVLNNAAPDYLQIET